jgi:hypothetical protein
LFVPAYKKQFTFTKNYHPNLSIKHQSIFITSTTMSASEQVQFLTNPADAVFDYNSDPNMAMSSYAQMMHMHTKQQMEQATRSCRRRSAASSAVNANAGLPTESSMESTSSRSSY